MRQICILFISIIICTVAQAQFGFGPKAGLNVSKISFSSANFKGSYKPGFYAGLFANYQLNAHWSGQLEALYNVEGGNEHPTNTTNVTGGNIVPTYVQLPLLAQYHTSIGLYAEAGPQLAFLLKIKEKYNGETSSIKQYYHTTEFRFPFGIGYQLPAGSALSGLGVNARYAFSFSKINKDEVGGQSLKSSVFSIGAFYKIPVKKATHKK